MKKLLFIAALVSSLTTLAQTLPESSSSTTDLPLSQVSSYATVGADSINFILLQRDPEMDEMVEYYRKTYPPSVTVHRGGQRRAWTDPTPVFSYYRIGGHRATVNNVEEYLGEVAPLSYKEFNRGRQLGRRSGQWFYAGLAGFALMLTSRNQGVRRFGLGVLTVGTTVSIGCAIAGSQKRRNGLALYNNEFR